MVLRACRYFGSSREYWWGALTWPLYAEMGRQLAEEPPVDQLVALYFAQQKWWTPPRLAEPAAGDAKAEPELWDSGLPECTE